METTINGSIVLPERWSGLLPPYYDQYISLDFNIFPFNSTDLVISGRYYKGTYSGTLTIHLVPGLTLGDVELNVEGNTTYVKIYGSIEIFYNQTLPIPGFTPPSRELIEKISSLEKDYIDQILYQATGGLVICELYNVTIVPKDINNDIIYVKIALRGPFKEIFKEILAGIYEQILARTKEVSYYERGKVARELVNVTLESTERASFRISYVRSIKELDFNFNLLTDLERIRTTSQIPVSSLPPELQQYLGHFKPKSYEGKLSYEDGVAQYVGNFIFEGDINARLNSIKDLFMNKLIESVFYRGQTQIPWQLLFANKTKIVDVNNSKFIYSQIIRSRPYSIISISFRGIKVAPPINQTNATCFRMEGLFDFAHILRSNNIPHVKLKIVIKGESNGTHIVIPIITEGMPQPDDVSADNTFVWNDVEFDKLRDLTFRVYEGSAYAVFKKFVSPEKPYIISVPGLTNCQVVINSVQSNAILFAKSSLTPPEGVAAPSEKYRVLGGYVQITSEGGEASGNFTIRIYYEKRGLADLNVDENSLKIHFWDQSAGKWMPVETHLNVEEHYAWANVDHLGVWALIGEVVSKPIWAELWLIILIATAIVVVAAVSLIALRRRRAVPSTLTALKEKLP